MIKFTGLKRRGLLNRIDCFIAEKIDPGKSESQVRSHLQQTEPIMPTPKLEWWGREHHIVSDTVTALLFGSVFVIYSKTSNLPSQSPWILYADSSLTSKCNHHDQVILTKHCSISQVIMVLKTRRAGILQFTLPAIYYMHPLKDR